MRALGSSAGSPAGSRLFLFPRGSAFLFLVLGAGMVSSYVFHLVMTRILGPAEYGTLGALLAALVVLGVPVNAVQAVVARRVAQLDPADEAGLRAVNSSALRLAGLVGGILAAALGATATLSAGFLRMESPLPVVLLALLVVPSLLAPVARGVLQGSSRFHALGWSMLVYVALRLVLGIALVAVGLGLTGAVFGLLVAEVVGALLVFAPLGTALGSRGPKADAARGLVREELEAASALLAFWVLVSLDVVLVRHYLPPVAAGRYSAAALVGRAVVFAAMAVAQVAYPRLADTQRESDRQRVVRVSGIVVITTGGGAALLLVAFPGLLPMVVGEAYRTSGALAPILALGGAGFGLAALSVYGRLAMGRGRIPLLWLAIPVEAAGIAAVHRSPSAVAAVVLATGCVVAVGMWPRSRRRLRRPVPEGELWRAAGETDLSVITPTFNGESTLAPSLRSLIDELRSAGIRFEVIVVSDGSTDGTVAKARAFQREGVRLLHYEPNRGKGHAVRTGLARATGRTIAFIDSDGDLDPADLVKFLTLMHLYDADMVVGSKRHPLSEVSYPVTRRILSWGYHILVRLLFGLRVRDTQTGIKLIRRETLAEVLPRLLEKRFAFDLELMVAARRAGYRRILEAPIRLRYQFASTISRRAVVGMARDTLAIWYRRFIVRQYDPEGESRQSPARFPVLARSMARVGGR